MRTRFLIVDDSELVRQSLRILLHANPEWEVCGEAANGLDAVELFNKARPNLVIMDFQMPGINGIEAAHHMLEREPTVPIVMFTQHASPELERRALAAGIRSVISKTDAFPMMGSIKALLDSQDCSTA